MSMHTHHDRGNFDSEADGSFWPGLLTVGAIFVLAGFAWLAG